MIGLLIGFVIPAVCFALFGVIMCLRKSSKFSKKHSRSSYSFINESEEECVNCGHTKRVPSQTRRPVMMTKSCYFLPASTGPPWVQKGLPSFFSSAAYIPINGREYLSNQNSDGARYMPGASVLPPSYSETLDLKRYASAIDRLCKTPNESTNSTSMNETCNWIP
ncbi:hypothetical protein DdX_11616 [Ditylenchus destructor]|uniref:Uncharacterized protein n=1 Tax=Ditylenchus destructor TaxID=166010 RepID=A0AAD4N0D6_9BILA|nr:hypothetical protein DdX_11616 [Ditylenchus destructor]